MKLTIQQLTHTLQRCIRHNFVTRPGRGSGLGVYLRRQLRRFDPQQIIGVNLAGFAFLAGVVLPQTQEIFSSLEVTLNTRETIVVIDSAPSTYQWPLVQFSVSQGFSYYHPGMDLTDPIGTPIYPIGTGVVIWAQQLPYGYGHHVLISHDGGIKSLYAHLSNILVRDGERVTKGTEIGNVGITGHTTGSHLHLEIYENNSPTNPLEVLPQIKFVSPTTAVPPQSSLPLQ